MLPSHPPGGQSGGRALPQPLHVLAVDRAAHGADTRGRGLRRLGHGRRPVLIMRSPMGARGARRRGRRGVPVPVVGTARGLVAVPRGLARRGSAIGPVVTTVPRVAPRRAPRMAAGWDRNLGRVVRLVRVVRAVTVVGSVGVALVIRMGARLRRHRGAALVVVVIRRARTAAVAAVGVGEATASDSVSLWAHDHQQLSGP